MRYRVPSTKERVGGRLRLLGALLAVALAMALAPLLAFAAQGDAANSLQVGSPLAAADEGETLSVTITMNQQTCWAKLYASADTEHATDLLADVEPDPQSNGNRNTYTVDLPVGDYVMEGFAYDGVTSSGTLQLAVDADHTSFEIATEEIYTTQTKQVDDGQGGTISIPWELGVDWQIENLKVSVPAETRTRAVTLGTFAKKTGEECTPQRGHYTVLCIRHDSISFTANPIGESLQTTVSSPVSISQVYNQVMAYRLTLPARSDLALTVPYADTNSDGANDFLVDVGQMSTYYIYTYIEPDQVDDPVDGKQTLHYILGANGVYYYRVNNPLDPDAVTYGKFQSMRNNPSIEVTREDMFIGDDAMNKNTLRRNFEANEYDVADLYLNVNAEGHLNMAQGDTFKLYPFRNWLLIESYINSQVLEPDFHVQVVDLDGTNAITATQHLENNSDKYGWTLTANNPGTAIVLVTYDAVTKAADGNDYSAGTNSAIWPENTGVFVVTVGGSDNFETGMTINEGKNDPQAKWQGTRWLGDYYDSEIDVLYYSGDEGAEYTFTPPVGTTVTMAVSDISSGTMTFPAFSDKGVKQNNDGSVTLSGLVEGKTIVKLENNGQIAYQVLRSKHLKYKIYKGKAFEISDDNLYYDSETGKTSESVVVRASDTITISYDRLYMPANKLSGIYNMGCYISLVSDDGTDYHTDDEAFMGDYTFASRDQNKTLTIPRTWEKDTFTLTGDLVESGPGSAYGFHRGLKYPEGQAMNGNATAKRAHLGSLPTITLKLGEPIICDIDYEGIPEGGSITTWDSDGNVVAAPEGAPFSLRSLPQDTYTYEATAPGKALKRGTFRISEAEDERSRTVKVDMRDLLEGAWDGESLSEPARVTAEEAAVAGGPFEGMEGYYKISKGSELAWMSAQYDQNNWMYGLTKEQRSVAKQMMSENIMAKQDDQLFLWKAIVDFGGLEFLQGAESWENVAAEMRDAGGEVSEYDYDVVCAIFEAYENRGSFTAPTEGNMVFTNDIDLAGYDFTPIGLPRGQYSGVVEGAGHAIYGLNIIGDMRTSGRVGLFGNARQCTFRNLTIAEGYIEPLAYGNNCYAGSFAAMLAESTLEGLVSEAEVVLPQPIGYYDSCYVGGIVGSLGAYGVIKNCRFAGSISAKALYGAFLGGIAGNTGFESSFTSCINEGSIGWSGEASWADVHACGIAAFTYDGTFDSCVNVGNISVPGTAGGIAGAESQDEFSISNSYNAGIIEGAGGAGAMSAGGIWDTHMDNVYYLDGSCNKPLAWMEAGDSVEGASAVTADELKSKAFVLKLGDAFAYDADPVDGHQINNGFPILRWQGGTVFESMAEIVASDIADLPAPEDVTVDDADAIAAAREGYEALSDEEKASVPIADVVKLALCEYARDVAQKAAEAAKQAEEDLATAEQAAKDAQDAADDAAAKAQAAQEAADKAAQTKDPADVAAAQALAAEAQAAADKAAEAAAAAKEAADKALASATATGNAAAIMEALTSSNAAEAVRASADKAAAAARGAAKAAESAQKAAEEAQKAADKVSGKAGQAIAGKAKVTKKLKYTNGKLAKNKKVNLKKAAKLSAKTALTFKKANKAGGKKIKVNASTGKVTFAKGLKAKKYKVKIKVTAAETAEYKAATKTVTLTVKAK